MNINNAVKKHSCLVCDYSTNRKYDLKRHQNAKHIGADSGENEEVFSEVNVNPSEVNVTPSEVNVTPSGVNVPPKLICKKCNKLYKNKNCLVNHEVKCKGVDELTCSRCMISFTTRQAKSKHISNNKCKPRSIMYARKPNVENLPTTMNNMNTQNNITTQNNNIQNNNIQNNTNNTQNNNTQNITIHNYGSERLDYLDYDMMLEIFKTAYNIPSVLTKHVHFNKDFPENCNIEPAENDKNYSLVKMNDEYIFKNLNNLIHELIKDKTRMMHTFAAVNKDNICIKMDSQIYEDIIELLLKLILLQEPSDHYKIQVGVISDMIKNSRSVRWGLDLRKP
jgi:hypothetical protein